MGKKPPAAPQGESDFYFYPDGLSGLLRAKRRLEELARKADQHVNGDAVAALRPIALRQAVSLIDEAIGLHAELVAPIGSVEDWPKGEGGIREPQLSETARSIDRLVYLAMAFVRFLTDQDIRLTDRTYNAGWVSRELKRKGADAANARKAAARVDYQQLVDAYIAKGEKYTSAAALVAADEDVNERTVRNHSTKPAPRNGSQHGAT